jgi:hypothetical protein
MPIKRVLCQTRLRRVPPRFSWVDHRLVRDKHICRCDVYAAALYLFLVTVGDARGLSYWSDASVANMLSMDTDRLAKARRALQQAGLIAYERPLYQVLALEPGVSEEKVQPMPAADRTDVKPVCKSAPARSDAVTESPVEMLRRALGGVR